MTKRKLDKTLAGLSRALRKDKLPLALVRLLELRAKLVHRVNRASRANRDSQGVSK